MRAIASFKVTKVQSFFAIVAIAAIVALGFSTLVTSNSTVKQEKILSSVESSAASIIFTQRETLVYATRLAQWANGGAPRRDVQIARNILAQRLAVIDTSGRSMGSRANKSYLKALRDSDLLVASGPIGVLPESLHLRYGQEVADIVDQIVAEARQLVVSYQKTVDRDVLQSARATADRNRLNLIYFYIFIISSGIFISLSVRTNFRNYRQARRELEVEQKRLDDTIAELKETRLTLLELQTLDEAKDDFISTVNHELRTPLTSIIGYLDLIKDEASAPLDSPLAMHINVVDRNAQMLLHLVESMLSLSKLDTAKGNLVFAKVCINTVLDDAIFIMKPATEKKNISVVFTAEDEYFVNGEAGQLNQIFINLLGNAIKFSPTDSSISLHLDLVKESNGIEYARVAVADHGIGIPQADVNHLFTRFFRAKNATSGQFPGTGLGLSIVQQIINLHSGEISVKSEDGVGTTFFVELPLYLTPEDKLIQDRRGEVLERAIASLEESTPESIEAVTHQIGGAIGFYGFDAIGSEILNYSRSLNLVEESQSSYEERKNHFLQLMYQEQMRINGGNND